MLIPNQIITYKNGTKVKAEELPPTSSMEVLVKCEECGIVKPVMYRTYQRSLKRNGRYCCKDCWKNNKELKNIILERQQETCYKKYGHKTNLQTEEFKEQTKQTCNKRYGCDFPQQAEATKLKVANTNLQRYGHTCSLRNPEIFEKAKITSQEHWGTDYPLQSKEVYEKTIYSMLENGTSPGSKMENDIYEIISQKYPNAKHTYIEGSYTLDIYLEINNIKIDIECDGAYWHPLDSQRDRIRDEINKRKGYKILRIRYDDFIEPEVILNSLESLINSSKSFMRIDFTNN